MKECRIKYTLFFIVIFGEKILQGTKIAAVNLLSSCENSEEKMLNIVNYIK